MTEQERLDAEIHAFIVDRRHLDYIESDRNADLITEWLEREQVKVSAESLHAAYVALHAQLDTYPRYPTPSASPPTPPAIPQQTQVQAEPESRLHLSERLPGESRLGVLQRAFAEEIAAQRKARQRMRAEMQNVPTDAARLAAAREARNQYAKSMRPYGKGAAIIKTENENGL